MVINVCRIYVCVVKTVYVVFDITLALYLSSKVYGFSQLGTEDLPWMNGFLPLLSFFLLFHGLTFYRPYASTPTTIMAPNVTESVPRIENESRLRIISREVSWWSVDNLHQIVTGNRVKYKLWSCLTRKFIFLWTLWCRCWALLFVTTSSQSSERCLSMRTSME